MKTALPDQITTRAEAMKFLQALIDNGESYHPEDDTTDIVWTMPDDEHPTPEEAQQLNKLMEDIYNIEGNNGDHRNPKFCPCQFILIHEEEATQRIKAIAARIQAGESPTAEDKEEVITWLADTLIEPGMGMEEIVSSLQSLFPEQYGKALDMDEEIKEVD